MSQDACKETIHTGAITHLSKPDEFDTAAQLIGEVNLDVHYLPGEHDFVDEGMGKAYLARCGKGTKGSGWYSFDDHGVHFAVGRGARGARQLRKAVQRGSWPGATLIAQLRRARPCEAEGLGFRCRLPYTHFENSSSVVVPALRRMF